jgi:DnaJ-class molecular chaperone
MEFYSILELDPNNRFTISQNDIRRQYKMLALKYHPDKYNGNDAEEKFIAIHMAYEILNDPNKKKEYDDKLCYDTYTDNWFDILCKKYNWAGLFFKSEKELQSDIKNFFEKKEWNNFKLSENVVRNLGTKINCNCTWKKDIILQIKINKDSLGQTQLLKYTRHKHIITGIMITFVLDIVELPIIFIEDFNYDEELFTVENKGNEIIENNRIEVGDLYLDVNFVEEKNLYKKHI